MLPDEDATVHTWLAQVLNVSADCGHKLLVTRIQHIVYGIR